MIKILTVFLMLTPTTTTAAERTLTSFVSGQRYLEFTEQQQLSYLSGAIDTLYALQAISASGGLKACIGRWSIGQVNGVFIKWLKDHPERWHLSAAPQVSTAIEDICPDFAK